MSTRNDGGMAFPMQHVSQDQASGATTVFQGDGGMTVRDYFAAHAPIDLAEAREQWHRQYGNNRQPELAVLLAILADMRGKYADTMIAERTK